MIYVIEENQIDYENKKGVITMKWFPGGSPDLEKRKKVKEYENKTDQEIKYYEVLYYTGKTKIDAMNGDFTNLKFQTKKEAIDYANNHLANSKEIFGIFVTSRDIEDEIVEHILY